MSLIDHINLRPITATMKETFAEWRNFFFPISMEAKIVLALITLVALWGLAIFTFGVPALVWPMKIIVPGIVVSLVLLT